MLMMLYRVHSESLHSGKAWYDGGHRRNLALHHATSFSGFVQVAWSFMQQTNDKQKHSVVHMNVTFAGA